MRSQEPARARATTSANLRLVLAIFRLDFQTFLPSLLVSWGMPYAFTTLVGPIRYIDDWLIRRN
jgi:hypothetical protein